MIETRRVVGIKTETTQGATTTLAATDYMIADVEYPDFQFEKLERDWHRSSYSPLPHVVGKGTVKIKIKTEYKCSGTAGTPYAPLGAAMQACGYTETVSAGTSITHAPYTVPLSGFIGPGRSATIEVFLGGTAAGTRTIIRGCVGNYEFNADINKIPTIEFDFEGTYVAQTTADFPTTTYLAQLPVVWQNSTASIHGVSSLNIKRWKINSGNKIELMEDSATGKNGIGGFFISGRTPTAEVEFYKTGLATINPVAIMASGAVASASFTVGTVAGNILTVTMQRTQIDAAKYSTINGRIGNVVPLLLKGNTGDDEISFVLT